MRGTGGAVALWWFLLVLTSSTRAALPPLPDQGRLVVLGDSITHSGQYIVYLEYYLRSSAPESRLQILNLGLPSETLSGLSEPGHAGGKFPRPDLHERLDRILARLRPDYILACYGMNDGIYYPFSERRFGAFQEGVRRLRAKVGDIPLIHVTPPVFDPEPIRPRVLPHGLGEYRQPYEGYDEVLGLYGAWLLAHRGHGWNVVDVHGPMAAFLREQRLKAPSFRLADDGVHANEQGHWLMAREILLAMGAPQEWGLRETAPPAWNGAVLKLIQRKQRLLRDAWLTEIGHQRPGMPRGLPLPEAESQVTDLNREIRSRLNAG